MVLKLLWFDMDIDDNNGIIRNKMQICLFHKQEIGKVYIFIGTTGMKASSQLSYTIQKSKKAEWSKISAIELYQMGLTL